MFLGVLFVLGNLLNNYLNSFESIESWNKFKVRKMIIFRPVFHEKKYENKKKSVCNYLF